MANATWLGDRLLELLTAAENSVTQARTGNVAPDRVGRTHNKPVAEKCTGSAGSGANGQLYVYLGNPSVVVESVKATSALGGNVHWVPKARFYVELWRCAPVRVGHGTPTAADLDTSAQQLAYDGWALVTGLEQAYVGGTLFPGVTLKSRPDFGQLIPLGPQGGLAGWQILVELPISDAGPSI